MMAPTLSSMMAPLFVNKGLHSQSYSFSSSHIRMWDLDYKESCAWRIDALELWCWRRLLRVPWTARRSNQSILREMSPEYSLERLMLKLKLQYFGHLMWRTDSLEGTLFLGKIECRRRKGLRSMRWLDGITDSWVWASWGSWWWTGRLGVLESMESQRVGCNWAAELLEYILETCSIVESEMKWNLHLRIEDCNFRQVLFLSRLLFSSLKKMRIMPSW